MIIQPAVAQITQTTVLALVIVSALFVIGLLVLLSVFLFREPEPLKYGNFFVVALGIMAALIGYLVAFPLIISGVFSDPTQVLAILSALFGTIVGLVGTYFGIKASSDATHGAQQQATESAKQAQAVLAAGAGTTGAGTTGAEEPSPAEEPPSAEEPRSRR